MCATLIIQVRRCGILLLFELNWIFIGTVMLLFIIVHYKHFFIFYYLSQFSVRSSLVHLRGLQTGGFRNGLVSYCHGNYIFLLWIIRLYFFQGDLATGDRVKNIYVWHMQEGGQWAIDRKPLTGHQGWESRVSYPSHRRLLQPKSRTWPGLPTRQACSPLSLLTSPSECGTLESHLHRPALSMSKMYV